MNKIQLIFVIFLLILVGKLQQQIWWSANGVFTLTKTEQKITKQRALNVKLKHRNQVLALEIVDLQNSAGAIEDMARHSLGMIGCDETFFLVID